jgi:hypothetical protein
MKIVSLALLFSSGITMFGAANAAPTIRILNVYQASSLWYFGNSESIFSSSMELRIAELNQAMANSYVNAVAQNVGVFRIDDAMGSDTETLVKNIWKDYRVQRERDRVLADIVIVTIVGGAADGGYALKSPANPQTAFAAVNALHFGSKVYAHEFAHLIGARHQASGAINGNSNDSSGAPQYARGYYVRHNWLDNFGSLHTTCARDIMAYPGVQVPTCDGVELLEPYFSNPAIPYWSHYTTVPFGAANADNARAMNIYAPGASLWRNTKISSGTTAAIINAIMSIFSTP